ncbi:HPr family phosphocarrier protein [Microbacterium sp. KHB019]|uniref:HPr family phosphocarrier protein n=1 Tax=Microbacterium sp. KHB019 TaxID=3129770 RepID=UPI003079AE0D
MPIRQVVISAHDGMHARPVADLARLALAHPDPVTLTTASGATVDVGSVLAVMDLALGPGDAVRLETAESATADSALDAMAGILDPRS